jgi:CheY-like chemotaxis protein
MFLSGAQIPDVIRRAHAAGGVYYLRKPFDPPVLLELVDKALWVPHVVGARLGR